MSAGDKKEWKLNVDKGYLSYSAKKKARPTEDETSTILNSAGRAKRAPFGAFAKNAAEKVQDLGIKRKLLVVKLELCVKSTSKSDHTFCYHT